MKKLKTPKLPAISLPDYFNREEFGKILNAIRMYRYSGKDCKFRQERLRALVLLMRWSGLGIQDAVTLEVLQSYSALQILCILTGRTNVAIRICSGTLSPLNSYSQVKLKSNKFRPYLVIAV